MWQGMLSPLTELTLAEEMNTLTGNYKLRWVLHRRRGVLEAGSTAAVHEGRGPGGLMGLLMDRIWRVQEWGCSSN